MYRQLMYKFGTNTIPFAWNRSTTIPKRDIWGWLNTVFNRVDKSRIDEVGPDRACAEWLLRCGAFVKWKGSERWQNDYNLLPAGSFEKYKIEEIDATDSCIMNIGFAHLKGLKHLHKMILHKCYYLDDAALEQLKFVANTLIHLQVSSCGNVSDKGIICLQQLQNLKTLLMYDLPEVRNRTKCVDVLQAALPSCKITFETNEELQKRQTKLKEEVKKE